MKHNYCMTCGLVGGNTGMLTVTGYNLASQDEFNDEGLHIYTPWAYIDGTHMITPLNLPLLLLLNLYGVTLKYWREPKYLFRLPNSFNWLILVFL